MGDTSKHLTAFRVENFKRFESFEMNDLGQFNLIVGDNNVGKTSVLEALLINDDPEITINNLVLALSYRNLVSISETTYNDILLYKNLATERTNKISIEYKCKGSEDHHTVNLISSDSSFNLIFEKHPMPHSSGMKFNYFKKVDIYPSFSFPFVPFYRGHDQDLTRFYGKIQADRSLKNSFVDSLKILVPEIENVELAHQFKNPHLIVYQSNVNKALPLAFFGDGTLKFFRLLAEIIINRGDRLMIDEIDTGIHFSRLKMFWKAILLTARDNDVQLFMTTHSDECIRYFKEVLEEPELKPMQESARSITLIAAPQTRQVKSFTYTFPQFEANIEVGNEIRGGVR